MGDGGDKENQKTQNDPAKDLTAVEPKKIENAEKNKHVPAPKPVQPVVKKSIAKKITKKTIDYCARKR